MSQLRTILWLRWRLTRNQWARSGTLNALITMAVAVLLVLVGAAGGIAGLLAGAFAMPNVSPAVMLLVWDLLIGLFLLFWLVGIAAEMQRAEAIDISRVLHMPISLRGIFFINYVASYVTLSIIAFLPALVGLSIGLAWGDRWTMIWLLPLVLGFLFMLTAWTYYLRGWLVMLMSNPRRYRALVAGATLAFILLTQLPALFVEAVDENEPPRRQRETAAETADERGMPSAVLLVHKVVPPLWVGYGAMSLSQGQTWPAVLGTAGACGLGALGLGCAYRSTRRFYEGRATAAKGKRRPKETGVPAARHTLLERTLPGVPQEAAALALASFRSLMRATEVKMALAINVVWLLVFGGMTLLSRSEPPPRGVRAFIATGAAVAPFVGMTQLMFNQFGFDRAGFRTLVLSAAPRPQILLGKNLALLPFALVTGSIILLLAAVALDIPPAVVAAAYLQLLTAFLLLSMLGNLVSSLVPHWVAPGSLKRTKAPAMTRLFMLLSHALAPAVVAPVFLPALAGQLFSSAHWLPAAPTNLFFSATELFLAIILYRLSLPSLGGLLQRREKQILNVVTQEVE